MSKSFVIREFGCIYNKNEYTKVTDTFDKIYLDDKSFSYLRNFIAENSDDTNDINQAFSCHRQKGKSFIKVKNYVGVIELKNKHTIEILPKVYIGSSLDEKAETRKLFLRMLRTLRNSPFKSIENAHLKAKKFPILEVFISAFLAEIEYVYKVGLKQHYVNLSQNSKFLKGQLLFGEHIRQNSHRKERFFISYDIFSSNIPHNKILKSTLLYLHCASKNPYNQNSIKKYLSIFDEIDKSTSYIRDFNYISVNSNRLYNHYENVLSWAKVFLMNGSFINFQGRSLNKAILFPMEKVFESYISAQIKKHHPEYQVSIQDRKHHLVEQHKGIKKFRIQPDIVLRKNGKVIYVIDVKWKLLDQSDSKRNYCINQSDMYQLFAYGKKYTSSTIPKLIMIYPQYEKFNCQLSFDYEINGLNLKVVGYDIRRTVTEQNIF